MKIAPPLFDRLLTKRESLTTTRPLFCSRDGAPAAAGAWSAAFRHGQVLDGEHPAVDIKDAELVVAANRVAVAFNGDMAGDRLQFVAEDEIPDEIDGVGAIAGRAGSVRSIGVGGDDLVGQGAERRRLNRGRVRRRRFNRADVAAAALRTFCTQLIRSQTILRYGDVNRRAEIQKWMIRRRAG